jgi:CDP-diacylglycerol--serine O-phosphatidyltransferase
MVNKKYLAPNAITAISLLLGFLSITTSISTLIFHQTDVPTSAVADGSFSKPILFIILAMICDGLDGKTARKLDAFSEFGKEFDSFADSISFGLAPGILIYCKLLSDNFSHLALIPIAFLYTFCGVMRLVKFNVITVASNEKGDFSGMPIPNAAAMVCSYLLLCNSLKGRFGYDLYNRDIFIGISITSAILMVSTIKFKTPESTYHFIPKKGFPIFVLSVLATLNYSLFIVSSVYILINLFYFTRNRFENNDPLANISDDDSDEYNISVKEYIEYKEEIKPPVTGKKSRSHNAKKVKDEKENTDNVREKSKPRVKNSKGKKDI